MFFTRYRPSIRLSALLTLLSVGSLGMFGAAQSATRTFVLGELDRDPATIEVSTDYPTILEFGGLEIELVQSSQPDQFTLEAAEGGNAISVQANQEDINTDLFVGVDGRKALFTLVSDADATSLKRYVISDAPPLVSDEQPSVSDAPLERELVGNSGQGGLERPTDTDTGALPPGLDFRVSTFRTSPDSMVIQYVLTNNSDNPIANDPQRLRVYADDVTVPYEREASPVPGRYGRLPVGRSEIGQIVVPKLPVDVQSLVLEWPFVEIGPGAVYRATRDLLTASGETLDATTSDETTPGDISSSGPSEAQLPSPLNEAASEPESPAVPPEFAAAMDAIASDRVLVGGIFETDEENRFVSGDISAVTVDSLLGTWFTTAHESATASVAGTGGEACVEIADGGSELWDVAFGYAGFPLTEDQAYNLRFDAHADKPIYFRSLVGNARSPFTESFARIDTLSSEPRTFFYPFEGREDSTDSRLTFFIGGSVDAPYRVCFDNIILTDVAEPAGVPAPPEAGGTVGAENAR